MNTLPKSALDQLARQQRAVADPHPDADLLTAFCEGALAGAERNRIVEHLARCSDCREIAFLAAPDMASQLQEQRAAVRNAAAASWWRRFMPAIAAAAATVVVGSAVLLSVYSDQRRAAQQAASGEIAVPAVPPSTEVLAKNDHAEAAPAEQQLQSKKAPVSAGKVALFKEESPIVVGGLGGSRQLDARSPQRSLGASGPHGPVEPKGSQSNYQNLAVTQRPTRVAPGAHGDLEAKGNAYFYENAAPPPQVSIERALALPPSPTAVQSAAAKPASRAETANIPASSPAGYAGLIAAPEKAKLTDKKAAPSAGAADDKQVVAEASTPDNFTSDVQVGEQDARRTLFITKHFQWRINDDGALQRSSGKEDWKPALAKTQTRFRVVSVIGNEVWAGGSAGKLYHSLDGGEHWMRIEVKASGQALADTITSINFRDSRIGAITTDSGATWETSDGGGHWTRK